jgi:hypothetical protein
MTTQPAAKSYSAFLPVALIALGIIALFSWNLIIALKQHSSGLRISIQQELQLTQATQTEVKLKAMMSDLIELSKQDKDAQKIVTRYKIAINK